MHYHNYVFVFPGLCFLHNLLPDRWGAVFFECPALAVLPVSDPDWAGLQYLGLLLPFQKKRKALAMDKNIDLPDCECPCSAKVIGIHE
jgi:hypothetical protein